MSRIVGLVLAIFVSSCVLFAPTEEEINAGFDAPLIRDQACQTGNECKIISPGCPIACSVSVNEGAVLALTQTAHRLIDEYNSGGQSCDYSCIQVYPVCVIDRFETRNV